MTIEKIKSDINNQLGNNVNIVLNGSRNKKEHYKRGQWDVNIRN